MEYVEIGPERTVEGTPGHQRETAPDGERRIHAESDRDASGQPEQAWGSRGERVLQERLGSEERAERFYDEQMLGHLNARMREFVRRQEMFFLATSDGKGECDNTFRAGSPGFLQVLDDRTVAYPEYRGNGVFASLGNIEENPHVALLLLDFQQDRIGLHINGRARVVADDDMRAERPYLPVDPVPGRRAAVWVEVTVDEAYVHCSKHIPHLAKVERPPHGEGRAWGTDDNRRKGGDYFGTAAAARARRGQDRRGPGRGRKQDPRPTSADRASEPRPHAPHTSQVPHQPQPQAPAPHGDEPRTPAAPYPQDQPLTQQQPQHQDRPQHQDQPPRQGQDQHQHTPAVGERPWDEFAERRQAQGQDEPAAQPQSQDQPHVQQQPWEPADFSQQAWDRPTAQLSRSQLTGHRRPRSQASGQTAAEPSVPASSDDARGGDDLPTAPPPSLDAQRWDASTGGAAEAVAWPPPPPPLSDPPRPADPPLPNDPLLVTGPPLPPWPPAPPSSPAAGALAPPQPPHLPQPPALPQPPLLPEPPALAPAPLAGFAQPAGSPGPLAGGVPEEAQPPVGTPNPPVPAIGAGPDQRRERDPWEGQAVRDEGRRRHWDQDRQVWQETVERVLDRARQPLAAGEGEREPFAGWFVEPHSAPKPPLNADHPATDHTPTDQTPPGHTPAGHSPTDRSRVGPCPSGPYPA